jgi:tripartite-type tricarboxylate transporter receptor subunit TctC
LRTIRGFLFLRNEGAGIAIVRWKFGAGARMGEDMKGALRPAVGVLLCVCYASADCGAAENQEPPLHIYVGFGAGSPPDIETRTLTAPLQTLLGRPVVVENRPGASGTIALQDLVNQSADGSSLLALPAPTAWILSLYPGVHVNLAKDVAPIGQINWDYNVLVVGNMSPAKSVSELVAALKAKPDRMNFASAGYGTPAHLVAELLMDKTHTAAMHVPYSQFGQAVQDVIAGRVDFMVMGAAVAVPQVQSGKLRALAVTSPKRLPALPDVPTFAEEGFPTMSVGSWVGLIAKSGTPAATIDKLNHALNEALLSPEIRSGLATLQSEPVGGTAEEFGRKIVGDAEMWKHIIREANITLQ